MMFKITGSNAHSTIERLVHTIDLGFIDELQTQGYKVNIIKLPVETQEEYAAKLIDVLSDLRNDITDEV